MTQKRIRALTTKPSLAPGDPGYVPDSNIYLPVDSSAYGSEPYKIALSSIVSSNHVESGIQAPPASAAISVTFDTAFDAVPITNVLKAYAYYLVSAGVYTEENVKIEYANTSWKTTTGFAITLNAEDVARVGLANVILEYYFTER